MDTCAFVYIRGQPAIIDRMVPGAPEAGRWFRPAPRRTLSPEALEQAVKAAFPHSRVLEVRPLLGGLRHANFILRLDSASDQIVLRIHEHDASLCPKEVDLMRLIGGSVPVPEVIHAEPRGLDDLPPFILTRYVEGINFRDLKRTGDTEAIAQAAYSAGEVLAAIGRTTFDKSGWLGPGPAVTAPLLEGADPMPRFIDLCLSSTNLQVRMPEELRHRTHDLVWSFSSRLADLGEERRLVHCDFNKSNLLVRHMAERWSMAAVLDWEFAVSGSPLVDFGNFLRYERVSSPVAEPHFSRGFLRGGGSLPQDWTRLARIVDLTALCSSLTQDELPVSVVLELVELIRATVENRDLSFG